MNTNDYIKKLEERVIELEEENIRLSEEAAQGFHQQIIFEKLSLEKNEFDITKVAVESIVTFKRMRYCAYLQIINNELKVICDYSLGIDVSNAGNRYFLSSSLTNALESMDGYIDIKQSDPETFPFLPSDLDVYDG